MKTEPRWLDIIIDWTQFWNNSCGMFSHSSKTWTSSSATEWDALICLASSFYRFLSLQINY